MGFVDWTGLNRAKALSFRSLVLLLLLFVILFIYFFLFFLLLSIYLQKKNVILDLSEKIHVLTKENTKNWQS